MIHIKFSSGWIANIRDIEYNPSVYEFSGFLDSLIVGRVNARFTGGKRGSLNT
ncbi:hypothetical protein Thini_1934 [Thiothrix nivea DSM 5205]|uniref:Uncharacterized protein n=1 Tax=Thiothrix nivea (strain ATCC 35100 / DSM 5205 / JP2) TaxID=870187 RepID=A0A656HGJ2_THINJ|nr:hypothetical protein Thini_1934 [Thiothrix nivea DSM 5205]